MYKFSLIFIFFFVTSEYALYLHIKGEKSTEIPIEYPQKNRKTFSIMMMTCILYKPTLKLFVNTSSRTIVGRMLICSLL